MSNKHPLFVELKKIIEERTKSSTSAVAADAGQPSIEKDIKELGNAVWSLLSSIVPVSIAVSFDHQLSRINEIFAEAAHTKNYDVMILALQSKLPISEESLGQLSYKGSVRLLGLLNRSLCDEGVYSKLQTLSIEKAQQANRDDEELSFSERLTQEREGGELTKELDLWPSH